MKKLFFFTVLLMAALFTANVSAQHVYIDDPCANGRPGTAWNAKNLKIGSVDLISSDGLPWPAWFYDPQGQIFGSPVTDKIDELSVVESNIIRVDEKGEMFLQMEWYARTLMGSSMRNFGARIRLNSSNEWDTLFTLRPEGGRFPAYTQGYEGSVEVSLGEKYNGKSVIFQLFFYNDPIANDAFIMAFRNVLLASYSTEPSVNTQIVTPQVAYGDTYEATLNCINRSLTPLTDIEYAYSVNGKAEKRQSVSFPDTVKSKSGAARTNFIFNITDADIDTTNRIQLWPVSIDGKTPALKDTLDFTLTVVDESRLDQDYVPVLECFTSATCSPCRALNPELNPVLIELKKAGKLNVVKYQVNWPGVGDRYYIFGNQNRIDYYKVNVAPTLVFNGMEKWNQITYPFDNLLNNLRKEAESASQKKAFFTITVNKAEVKPDSTVELDFDITSHLPATKPQRMDVYAMVIEGTTHGNRVIVVEQDFHYVNMAFATPATGKISYFLQELTNDYTYTLNMKKTNVEELSDLQVLIFVQDPTDNYIYQSKSVLMGPGELTAVEDEALAQVAIYPNPAANTVYVAGLEKARVEIFDLGGRRVYEKTGADGVLEISVASFAKGAYVVRIAQNGAVASRKLVVK